MASIQKRTRKDGTVTYRVQVRMKAHPAESATFKRLTDAKQWEKNTESAMAEGRHFKTRESQRHTLADMLDRYIKDVLPTMKPAEGKDRKQVLAWFKGEIGDYTLADITPSKIVGCRDKLLSEPTRGGKLRANATVARYLAVLSHAFTVAVDEWGWLEDSPMRKVKKPTLPRGRVRFLSEDENVNGELVEGERTRLLRACKESSNPYLYPVVVLALSTGMRQGEIMGLTWPVVDLQQGQITLYETKNGEIRVVPIAGHALGLLKAHAEIRPNDTDLLFPSKVRRDKPQDLRAPWRAALDNADISDFKFHDLLRVSKIPDGFLPVFDQIM